MRTFNFATALVMVTTIAFGQLDIQCNLPGCSTPVKPNEFVHSYTAVNSSFTGCSGGLPKCKFKWEVTNGRIINTPGGTGTTHEANYAASIGVRWNNVNSPGKVKVTVSNSPNCSSCPAGSKEITLDIMYLGTPGPIKLDGVAYTGTKQWPCTTSSIAVSVDPATNATNYNWEWPSGWSGPSTSTSPSVTVTPSKKTNGIIRVKARRSDVADLETSSSLTISRPLPDVVLVSSENVLLCNPSSTINLTGYGYNVDKYVWEPSGGHVKVNGSTTTVEAPGPATVTTTGDGYIYVSGYNATCDAYSSSSRTVTVKYGAPQITSYLINGIPEHLYVPYYPAEVPNGSRIAIPAYNAASYSWTLVAGTAPLWPVSGNEHMCDISYIIDYARIEGKATNACGSATHLFYLVPPGGSMLVAYPNPATETLTLQLANIPQEINLFTEASTIAVRSFNSKEINDLKSLKDGNHEIILNVKDLPRGTYYLHIEQKDKKTEKIRVQLI